MLGQEVFSRLKASSALDVIGTYNSKQPSNLDSYRKFSASSSAQELTELINGASYVINCIAVLKLSIDEKNAGSVQLATEINSNFPRSLAELASKQSTNVIHISTDGVFSGNSESPLSESSVPLPNDVYGKSKLAGEAAERNVINIRTSIIGRDPTYQRGLLEWFLKQPEQSSIQGYDDIWHGVTNGQLAELIKNVVENDCFAKARAESNVHHFVPNNPVTKADLLAIFKRMFNKDITINKVVNPNGTVNRSLTTCYKTLLDCYTGKTDIESALKDLK